MGILSEKIAGKSKHWFLRIERMRESAGKYVVRIFLVNPVLNVSMLLNTHVGNHSGYKCIEAARVPAIAESKNLRRKFRRNEIPPERLFKGIQGKRTLSFSIV